MPSDRIGEGTRPARNGILQLAGWIRAFGVTFRCSGPIHNGVDDDKPSTGPMCSYRWRRSLSIPGICSLVTVLFAFSSPVCTATCARCIRRTARRCHYGQAAHSFVRTTTALAPAGTKEDQVSMRRNELPVHSICAARMFRAKRQMPDAEVREFLCWQTALL
jgi:hypothetical protein